MAGNMDERVVSMEFDNRQFEKNVKTSMKTLDDLKDALDFDKTGESLDKFDEKFKKFGKNNVFEDMDSSVTSLRKGLGVLGDTAKSTFAQFAEITKITAMIELAEQAFHRLEAAVKSFTIQPITQGFDKYTTKISSIKTIANATGMAADDVNTSLDRLNWFTDETSASFESMVQNIGKFTSVGKGLDESITAMQGIAAWGYHSGAGIAEQNRAMYNLSQALGTGSVKLIDWKSIENAGMATKEFKEQAIAAAEAAGTLTRKGDKLFAGKDEVTSENFNSTLQKGWFTSDVLMSTLKQYGSFADEVKKYQEENAIDTAAEAMELMDAEREENRQKYLDELVKATKKSEKEITERVEKINKITDTKAREKEIKAFAEEFSISVKDATKYLDELATTEETLGEKAFKSSQQSKTFTDSIEATKDAVSTGWMNTFQYIFGGLDKSIELWSDVTDILWDLFAAGASFRNNAFQHWAENFNGWADLWNADEEAGPLGALRNIANTIIELKDLLGSSFKNVFFSGLEQVVGGFISTEDRASAVMNGLKTDAQIQKWREGQYTGYEIKKITKGIREFTARINEFFTNTSNVEKLRNIFTAIATAVKFAAGVVSNFFGAITNFVTKSGILQDILNLLSRVATKVTEVFNKLQDSGFVKKIFGGISDTFVWIYNLVKGWITQIKDFFEETGIIQSIRDWFNGIIEWFTGSEKDVDENGKKTESGFFRAFSWIQDVKAWFEKINLKDILYDIKYFIDNFGTIWRTFIQAINGTQVTKDQFKQGGVSDKLAGILEAVSNFGSKIAGVWGFIKGVFDSVVGWLESSGILPAIRGFWDKLVTFFGNLGLVWEALTTGKVADPKALNEKQKGLVNGVISFAKKIQNAFNKVKGWFTSAWEWIKDKWNLLVGWLESSGILPTIRNAWDKIKLFFGNISEAWSAFKTALTGEKLDKKALKDSGMSEGLQGIIETVWGWGSGIHSAIEWVKQKFEVVKNWLETSGILPTLRSWWSSIIEWFNNVKKDIEENGVFKTVSDFFTNLWDKITGLFGGGEDNGKGDKKKAVIRLPGVVPAVEGEEANNKGGFFQSIKEAFTNDGRFDLIKGLSTGITKLFEAFGSLDWTSMSSSVFGAVVKVINGLDNAVGKLQIDNIIRFIHKIISAFSGVLILKGITDITTTFRAVVKKGKDKSVLEQFTDLLSTLGTALLQIGITIALIAGSLWVISKIDKERFDSAIAVLAGIGVFLIAFMAIAYVLTRTMGKDSNKLAKTFSAIGVMFLEMAIAIAIVVASVWLITKMLGENGAISGEMWVAMGIVAGIMLVMSGIVVLIAQLTKKVGTVNIAIGIATFAGIAILLAVCVAAILLLQNVKPDKAFIVIGELVVLLIAIGGLIFLLSRIKKFNPKMVIGLIAMAAMLALVVAALVILKNSQPGQMIEIAGAIGIVIAALVGALVVCSLLGPKVLIGAAVLAGGLVILAAGLVIVAKMASGVMSNVVSFMSSLAAVSNSAKLVDIEAIKNALGVLPVISDALLDVVDVNTKPALNLIQAAYDVITDLKLASKAAILVDEKQFHKIFGKDGKSGLLQTIQTGMSGVTDTGWKASALGRSVETLAENLKLVGRAGLTLTQDFNGHTYTEGIQNVKDQLANIQEIVNLASTIGTVGEGEGAKQFDLTAFATGIANVGAALEAYNLALGEALKSSGSLPDIENGEIAPISTESITSALISVMSAMKGVTFDEGEIGNIESWAGLKTGEGNQTLFALGLINIANAMEAFGDSAEKFDSGAVDKAIGSLDKLAEIKAKFETNSASDYKGMMDDVSTWGDGGDFKTAISGMGTAIAAFGDSVKNLPENSVTNATNALDTLAVIYEKLKSEGSVETYLAKIGELTIGGASTTTESVEKSFQEFAEGISKLGDGLAAFSGSLTDKEIGYDQEKVDSAVEVLQDMTKIETELKTVKVDSSWWNNLLFGENGIKKLGSNMADLGAYMATFSQQLSTSGGFDIDVNSKEWKNISGVITFMAGIQTEMNNLVRGTETYDENTGQVRGYMESAGYTISDLANGLDKIREALVNFNAAMQKSYTAEGSGVSYKLGEWIESNWNNIKSVITFLKDISIELKNAGLKEGAFYDLDALGYDMQNMFNRLDNSKMGDFLSKMQNFSDMTEALKTFTGGDATSFNTQGIALAAEMITGFANRLISTEVSDGKGTISSSMTSMLGEIDKYNSDFNTKGKTAGDNYISGFMRSDKNGKGTLFDVLFDSITTSLEGYKTNFFNSGKAASEQYIAGFINNKYFIFGRSESQFSKSLIDPIVNLLSILDSKLEEFKNKGKSAGEQYALGFKEGMAGLSPIVSMDSDGKVDGKSNDGGNQQSIAEILTSLNFATSDNMVSVLEKLETLNSKFNEPIDVKDQHEEIVTAVGKVEDKLGDISTDVSKLETDVNNLRVYIDKSILVGSIIGDIDKALGNRARRLPV